MSSVFKGLTVWEVKETLSKILFYVICLWALLTFVLVAKMKNNLCITEITAETKEEYSVQFRDNDELVKFFVECPNK